MGGEKERAEVTAFDALLAKCLANALLAKLQKEADTHEVGRGSRASAAQP
jgi:hypothetical protein